MSQLGWSAERDNVACDGSRYIINLAVVIGLGVRSVLDLGLEMGSGSALGWRLGLGL